MSKSERSREFLSMFGTPFEELDESEGASKKPLSVENQIVTDEKGRRRFHGAFTGGFSAGYFNTVGTKEGWIPSTFKSTRSRREDTRATRPEDFMDSEDLGEYGIAPRQIRTTQAFTEDVSEPVENQKRRFAGETSSDVHAIADRLSDLVRPISDSIGVKLMKSMGWRPGKGVGAAQLALVRERAKAVAKTYGCELPPNVSENAEELAAAELEVMAPGFQFAPGDVDFIKYDQKTNLHGLGYQGLNVEQHLRSAKASDSVSGLKLGAGKTKGIRGQAFGVGAFEDDDEDLYGAEDLSKYDYSLGGSGAAEKQGSGITDFVPATKSQAPRRFFPPPKLPRDYTPSVPSALISKSQLDGEKRGSSNKAEDQTKTALQRANVLGESNSVWSLVSAEDRRRIENIKTGHSSHVDIKKEPEPEERRKTIQFSTKEDISKLFPADSKKRSRFQEYVNYLKRGLCPAQPPDLTEWDWEMEQIEFRKLLPSELVQASEDTSSRQKPLAGAKIAAAFSGGFKSKFTKSAYAEDLNEPGQKIHEDEDKIKAVQMKMFGAMTREKHEWHPDKVLCKRFNVPNPYPESRVVGVPYLKKDTKAGLLPLDFDVITSSIEKRNDETGVSEISRPTGKTNVPIVDEHQKREPTPTDEFELKRPNQEEEPEKPPISLFKAIFADSSSSSESEDEQVLPSSSKDYNRLLPSTSPVSIGKEEKTVQLHSIGMNNKSKEVDTADQLPVVVTLDRSPSVAFDEPDTSGMQIMVVSPTDRSDVRDDANSNLYGPVMPPEITGISVPSLSVVRKHKREKKSKHRHRHRKHEKRKGHSYERKSSKKHRKHRKEHKRKSKQDSSSDRESDSNDSIDSND